MSVTSRTGLIPAPKRSILNNYQKDERNKEIFLSTEIAKPVELYQRPFAELHNPYAKRCSVLCNHPAPNSVRNVINRLRVFVTSEYKIPQIPREKPIKDELFSHETDNIPEDLFRRYTDTDSRPLTPSPSATSIRTKTSAGGSFAMARRCITPELGNTELNARKKIILDLRRSHSQETLYWNPSSEISQEKTIENIYQEKKHDEIKAHPSLMTGLTIPEEEDVYELNTKPISPPPQPQTSMHEDDVRRGRRKKKMKSQQITTTFHRSEDPETQIATLGPDSLNPSTRPSLIPNTTDLLPNKDTRESEPIALGSFLTDEAFQALRIQLDVDVIENTFERYLNRARREAYKYIPQKPVEESANAVESSPNKTTEKFPRKFSKSSARFEVPLRLKSIESIHLSVQYFNFSNTSPCVDMSVLDYLSTYVWVSNQYKYLFKKTFLKYLKPSLDTNDNSPEKSTIADTNYVERTISAEHLDRALEDVLEFHGTSECIAQVLELLNWNKIKVKSLNFRSWCGIVSFAERLSLQSLDDSSDSCDELEKCDFSTMEEMIEKYNVPDNMRTVLGIIRRSHNVKDSILF